MRRTGRTLGGSPAALNYRNRAVFIQGKEGCFKVKRRSGRGPSGFARWRGERSNACSAEYRGTRVVQRVKKIRDVTGLGEEDKPVHHLDLKREAFEADSPGGGPFQKVWERRYVHTKGKGSIEDYRRKRPNRREA